MLGYCERNLGTKLISKQNKIFIISWSSINEVTEQEEGAGERFCDESTRALVIKSVTTGRGVSKMFKNCLTSFMDDHLGHDHVLKAFNIIP
jgi:hypothetical protein